MKLRDVKTTLGMEFFNVKTPEMAHKTLYMMIIAYNLLRALMQRSSVEAGLPVWHMSFKGTLDLINASHGNFKTIAGKPLLLRRQREEWLAIAATKTLDIRPFRREPRALKRRPKPFQILTSHRHVFQEQPHKGAKRSAA